MRNAKAPYELLASHCFDLVKSCGYCKVYMKDMIRDNKTDHLKFKIYSNSVPYWLSIGKNQTINIFNDNNKRVVVVNYVDLIPYIQQLRL